MTIHIETFTIGQFIAKLKEQPTTNEVVFDFCRFVPTTFDSYRGFYEELALGYDSVGHITVENLLDSARDAQHNVFEGYKGGFYTMSPSTNLWVDNYGRYTSTAIVDVIGNDYKSVIVTTWIDPT